METWIPIKGYEGLYEVSDLGRFRSLDKIVRCKNGFSGIRKGILLKIKTTRRKGAEGYQEVTLRKDYKSRSFMAHRLVALNFIPNPEGKATVNHKYGVRWDNRPSQLEWMTHEENMKDSHSRRSSESYNNPNKGALNHNSKLTDADALLIKTKYNKGGTSLRKLANEFGVHHGIIFGIIKGKRWPHITLKTA